MKTKLKKLVFLFFFILYCLSAAAQDTPTQQLDPSPLPIRTPLRKPDDLLTRPEHHFLMPRRQTRLQFNRFQEKIDLDDKLKKSNKALC